jgi:hypothetical protein
MRGRAMHNDHIGAELTHIILTNSLFSNYPAIINMVFNTKCGTDSQNLVKRVSANGIGRWYD